MNEFKQKIVEILESAGIKINGSNSWDIQVHNEDFYSRVLAEGSLGLGESYMDGWWDCDQVDELFSRILTFDVQTKLNVSLRLAVLVLKSRILNLQSKKRATQVAKEHYDLDTVLFEKILDKNMQYTCGYWKDAKNLDDAQAAKLHLICKKLGLRPGMTFLDIGSGWGQLVNFAVENYGVKATGITISKEQLRYCKKTYKNKDIKFILTDYRDMTGSFDRIATVGMIEHVGYKNYRRFFTIISRLLTEDGLYLLHTIGSPVTTTIGDPWVMKYIFPNGMIPSGEQLSKAAEKLFIMEDWHSFGADYDKTLMAWARNFEDNWPTLRNIYDERFYRMWRYYLLIFAGCFRSRKGVQLWQIVFSKNGVKGGYSTIR